MSRETQFGEVRVSIRTVEGPEIISSGGGGIRLTVEDTRVNRFLDEDEFEWNSWMPEFVGDFIAVDLGKMVDVMIRLQSGDVPLYEEEVVRLEGSSSAFVFEPLTDDIVRVAFRVVGANRGDNLLAAPESARGYLVAEEALCQAVADAGEEFVKRAKSHGFDDRVEGFEEKLNQFED